MTMVEYLAKQLLRLRARYENGKGISQYELANRTGVPQSVIWRLEHARQKHANVAHLRRLAQFFGVSVDSLVATFDPEIERESAGVA